MNKDGIKDKHNKIIEKLIKSGSNYIKTIKKK